MFEENPGNRGTDDEADKSGQDLGCGCAPESGQHNHTCAGESRNRFIPDAEPVRDEFCEQGGNHERSNHREWNSNETCEYAVVIHFS